MLDSKEFIELGLEYPKDSPSITGLKCVDGPSSVGENAAHWHFILQGVIAADIANMCGLRITGYNKLVRAMGALWAIRDAKVVDEVAVIPPFIGHNGFSTPVSYRTLELRITDVLLEVSDDISNILAKVYGFFAALAVRSVGYPVTDSWMGNWKTQQTSESYGTSYRVGARLGFEYNVAQAPILFLACIPSMVFAALKDPFEFHFFGDLRSDWSVWTPVEEPAEFNSADLMCESVEVIKIVVENKVSFVIGEANVPKDPPLISVTFNGIPTHTKEEIALIKKGLEQNAARKAAQASLEANLEGYEYVAENEKEAAEDEAASSPEVTDEEGNAGGSKAEGPEETESPDLDEVGEVTEVIEE